MDYYDNCHYMFFACTAHNAAVILSIWKKTIQRTKNIWELDHSTGIGDFENCEWSLTRYVCM